MVRHKMLESNLQVTRGLLSCTFVEKIERLNQIRFFILLPQAHSPLFCVHLLLLRRNGPPLRVLLAEVDELHGLKMMPWVERDVALHQLVSWGEGKALLKGARFRLQLGVQGFFLRVDAAEQLLTGDPALQIFVSGLAGLLDPVLVSAGDGLAGGRGVAAVLTLVKPCAQPLEGEKIFVLGWAVLALQVRPSLFASIPAAPLAVAVICFLVRLWYEIAPAVLASGDALTGT